MVEPVLVSRFVLPPRYDVDILFGDIPLPGSLEKMYAVGLLDMPACRY